MREIVIISGKGGTGKTSIAAAFASLMENGVLCDADVDAANLHLLLKPKVVESHSFMGGGIAEIRNEDCVACGICREVCKFDAISEDYHVDSIACEGCGVCVDMCPQEAIDFPIQQCGEWFHSETRFGPMIHARLGIAEENSGKLVSLVRQQGRELAEAEGRNLLLTDGPPGVGCPVIAAIGGAAALVIVVEPTVSGLHDMQRVAELGKHFGVPGLVAVNKFDLNLEMTEKIEAWAVDQALGLVGRIPFDSSFVEAMVAAENIIEFAPESDAAKTVREIWKKVLASKALNNMGIADLR
ncbi:MAG: 4Fe-4S binding protein [Desulforhopalus sp.]|nr:4Fe-4S binding protein [Desulforhopalus sp.]